MCSPFDDTSHHTLPSVLLADSPRFCYSLPDMALPSTAAVQPVAIVVTPTGVIVITNVDHRNRTSVARGHILPASPTPENANQPSWAQWAPSAIAPHNLEQAYNQTGSSGCCKRRRFWVLEEPHILLLMLIFAIGSVNCVRV